MPTNNLERVVFAFDNHTNLRTLSKALARLDTLRAMGEIKDKVVPCIGSYQDKLEHSYMVTHRDWQVIRNKMGDLLEGQECVLHIPGDTRQPTALRTVAGTHMHTLSPLGEVENVSGLSGWTYVIETGKYFTY